MASPDLSAAFDTVDYTILFHRLQTLYCVNGTVIEWSNSIYIFHTCAIYFIGIHLQGHYGLHQQRHLYQIEARQCDMEKDYLIHQRQSYKTTCLIIFSALISAFF